MLGEVLFFVGCFLAGLGISLLSSEIACQKLNWSTSAAKSAFFSLGMTIVHALLPWTQFLRQPLLRLCNEAGLLPPYDDILADVYVLMLASWPLLVWLSLGSQTDACLPTPDEKAAFKQELQAHLKKLNGTAAIKPTPKG